MFSKKHRITYRITFYYSYPIIKFSNSKITNEKFSLFTRRITFYPIPPSIIRHSIFYSQKSFDLGYDASRIIAGDTFVCISRRAFLFFQRETTPRNSARLVSLLSCARIEQLRLARTPLFHSATASRRVIVTLANFASTILHAATRHAWNRRFVPAFSSFLLIRHCSEKNHPWWAVVYGMRKSKLLLEQINLKSEKWIRGMEIVEQFWNRYFFKFIIGGRNYRLNYYVHVSLNNLRY